MAGGSTPQIGLKEVDDVPWIVAPRFCNYPIFSGTQRHAMKIINLRTNRIPSPCHLTAWHIDRVDRLDFFRWSHDEIVEMSGRDFVPQLTVVQLISHRMNLNPLSDKLPVKLSVAEQMTPYLAVTDSLDPDLVSEFVNRWITGVPAGWQQIEAIVEHLRAEFEHDPLTTVPEGCEDTVQHFLTVRRGPDYLFASTAAVMARTLGYPARLVSGFYADLRDYDRESRQTIVENEDAHVWAEVCLDGRTWIPIEPTPGYDRPRSDLGWTQRLAKSILTIFRWIQANRLFSGAVFCFGLGLTIFRLEVFDITSYAFWKMVSFGSTRRRILWTVRVLEWRGWMAGSSRPKNRTLRQWYVPLTDTVSQEEAESLQSLITLSDWAYYWPQEQHEIQWPSTNQRIIEQCRCVGRRWTSRRISRQTRLRLPYPPSSHAV